MAARRRRRIRPLAVLATLLVLGAVAMLVLSRSQRGPGAAKVPEPVQADSERRPDRGGGPTVAIIIDDWGYNRGEDARELLELDAPLTLSILPGLPYSARFAREAAPLAEPSTRRREVMLHLPMEPVGYPDPDPGPQAVMTGMTAKAIAARVEAALADLPEVRGVNNHMGSAATADTATMRALMGVLRGRGLYFVDSMTSDRSVAAAEAARAGLQVLRNRIFLDHDDPPPQVVRQRLATLIEAARSGGFAVGIGHPLRVTAHVLAQEIPRLQAEGVRFVTISELLALQAATN